MGRKDGQPKKTNFENSFRVEMPDNRHKGYSMASVNKVILVGNLGSDRKCYQGTETLFATSKLPAFGVVEGQKQTSEKKETTEWHRVVLVRQLAEIAGKYLKKGIGLCRREDHDAQMAGQRKEPTAMTEITGNEMKMLGGGRQDGDSGERTQQRGEPQKQAPAKKEQRFEDMDDDIPF